MISAQDWDPYLVPSRRRIVLMRHASVSYYNDEGVPLDPESVRLNNAGIRQAGEAAELLARHGVEFDRVLTSNLPRTVQTADIILERLNLDLPRHPHAALAEIRKGHYAHARGRQLHDAFLGPFRASPPLGTRFQFGESLDEVFDRLLPVVEHELANPHWCRALWVLHGGINRALLSWWLCGERRWLGNLLQQPACINLVDVAQDPGDTIVRAINLWASDLVQDAMRISTVEAQLVEFERGLERASRHRA
jgi:probable phosphoglycerate mutase